jgi:hypothetical protein
MLRAADAMSIRTAVERTNPDWDDEKIDTEVIAIKDDKSAGMPELPEPGGPLTAEPDTAEPAKPEPETDGQRRNPAVVGRGPAPAS